MTTGEDSSTEDGHWVRCGIRRVVIVVAIASAIYAGTLITFCFLTGIAAEKT